MRLFVAIPVGEPALGALGRLLDRYRRTGWPVKWVGRDGLHLTLKFLGQVEEERVAEIGQVLREAVAGTPILSFSLTELGAFPTLHRPRVLWVGLEAEPALELLVNRLEQRFEPLGFAKEGRPFRPHVTLGRIREGRQLPPEWLRAWETQPPQAAFTAPTLVLFESRLSPAGARYFPRLTLPLGT
jgi:2'-5' RNA ligase